MSLRSSVDRCWQKGARRAKRGYSNEWPWTRVADLILAAFGVYVAARMAFGPDILTLENIRDPALREMLAGFLPLLLKGVLFLALFGSVVEAIKKLLRIFRQSEAYGRVAAYVKSES